MEFIKGYGKLYKINKLGQIYSCRKGIIMRPQISKYGYLYIVLTGYDDNGDKIKNKNYIHRLLAIQYLHNSHNKSEVEHIDNNNKNNDLTNLRWVYRIDRTKRIL